LFEEADTSDYRKVLGHPFGVDRTSPASLG
jgi:hypothetical protein